VVVRLPFSHSLSPMRSSDKEICHTMYTMTMGWETNLSYSHKKAGESGHNTWVTRDWNVGLFSYAMNHIRSRAHLSVVSYLHEVSFVAILTVRVL